MPRPSNVDSTRPADLIDDGLTEAQIAERVAAWLKALEDAPPLTLPVTAAEELEAARRDGDL